MTLKSDAKFEEKLALGSKNDMMNLVNFNASSGKSENLHLCYFCQYHIKFQLKKYRRIISHDTKKKIQTFKKNWLFVWKMTWGIWGTLFNPSSGKSRWNFLFVARYSLLFARCSLPFAHCSLLSALWSLVFARCSLLFARCSTKILKDFFWVKVKKKGLHINS